MSTLYRDTAKILEEIISKKVGVKTALFKCKNKKLSKIAAMIYSIMNMHEGLFKVVKQVLGKIVSDRRKQFMLVVLVYEKFFGSGKISGGGHFKRVVVQNNEEIENKIKALGLEKPEDVRIKIYKYGRINTLKTNLNFVMDVLQREGFLEIDPPNVRVENLDSKIKSFWIDQHIENLLGFPSSIDLHDHEFVKTGKLILQDKSSNFTPNLLNLNKNSVVIDCCAAPGNKTSQLAEKCWQGKVLAFERNEERCRVLESRLNLMGMYQAEHDIVQIFQQDFLEANVLDEKFQSVTHVMVDPSCSGSGMISRLVSGETASDKRLYSLAGFQKKILSHALSFPNVIQVAYSTCSIHDIENEQVVEYVLENFPEFQLKLILPNWPRRGLNKYPFGSLCVRVNPKWDKCNGFFCCLFQKKQV